MYILKNALRCIARSKGRSILIGIIALVIAVSACLGLSIRQAAESAREEALDGMRITATVSYDRGSMMNGMGGERGEGGFDKDAFREMIGASSSLTVADYEKYAEAPSVESFYYTVSAYVNGSDGLSPVETSDDSFGMPNGMNGGKGGMSVGDFTLVGYSSDAAMTAFVDGTASILEGGAMFEEGTEALVCVISEELSLYNDIAVGDTLTVVNPSLETESYTLTVSGIYTSAETNDFSASMQGMGMDPANSIYMSAAALSGILSSSSAGSITVTDENGNERGSTLSSTVSASYLFASIDAYEAFTEEVRALGLPEEYTVSSADVSAFESRLAPLDTLSTMAGWFLLVILLIGGIILVVLNIFNVRERKYEVGVLTAMGMKKWKVALQFTCEILAITMLAVLIGAGVGAVSSVPVTNALLEGQITSQSEQQSVIEGNFGRPGSMGGGMGGGMMGEPPTDMGDLPSGGGFFEGMMGGARDYISEINAAMNLTVVLEMIGIGLLLTLVASTSSVLFIMRYDPLRILANRD